MTPLIRKAIKFAPEPETAMWFDVGSCAEVKLGSLDSETFMHLPYKRTRISSGSPASLSNSRTEP